MRRPLTSRETTLITLDIFRHAHLHDHANYNILHCPTCWLGTIIHSRQVPKLALENLEPCTHLLRKWHRAMLSMTSCNWVNNWAHKNRLVERSVLWNQQNPKCNLVAEIMWSKLAGGGLAADCMAKVPRPDSKDVQVLTLGSPDMCRQHLIGNYLSKIWRWLARILQKFHSHCWNEYHP